jgi:hypothetical protein
MTSLASVEQVQERRIWIGHVEDQNLQLLASGLWLAIVPGEASLFSTMVHYATRFSGGGGELASEGVAVVGADKGDRSACPGDRAASASWAMSMDQVEACTGDRDDIGETATRASASLCAVLRTSSEVSVPRATIVTSRWSGERST